MKATETSYDVQIQSKGYKKDKIVFAIYISSKGANGSLQKTA